MPQRRHHYERAFESYLRDQRIRYVSVDEARRAFLPDGAKFRIHTDGGSAGVALKSFDFVLYGESMNWLVDVKGRQVKVRGRSVGSPASGRMECWATRDDIQGLKAWERLFGEGFRAALIFVYWCEDAPPAGLFQDLTEYQGRWYALRSITADDYASAMKTRSARWGTVDLAQPDFERLSQPLVSAWRGASV